MRRLHPLPNAAITVDEAYAAPLGTRSDRPWVSLSMVSSLDGSTVIAGSSGLLGNSTDAAVFRRLRSLADVIIVGSGTARAEVYGPPSKPGQRVGVVTASGRVDLASELFTSGSGFLITTDGTPLPDTTGVDAIRAGRHRVDLRVALDSLGSVCGEVATVQAEGGSTLNGSLLEADLIDEIDLTTAPLAAGGGGARLAVGTDFDRRFAIEQLYADDESYLFTRWLRMNDRM